ncbi:MAG: response regulator transcription factor [Flavobacteriales bacterium]|jgi:DNA-binding LytR/AlgR family response regulator|nr:response regulator transcription factor [Flavobacteriales bacterium]
MTNSILIVEDDPFISISLEGLLKNNHYHVVDSIDNAEDAYNFCKNEQVDLILLDIRLSGEKTGLWLEKELKKIYYSAKIIFLTAFNDQETIDGILNSEADIYLTKPINRKSLISNIQLVLKQKTEKSIYTIAEGKKKHQLDIRSVLFIKSDGNYLIIHQQNGNKITLRKKLKEIQKEITCTQLIRVHQSFLVNKNFVTTISSTHIFVEQNKIPISKPYRGKVRTFFRHE